MYVSVSVHRVNRIMFVSVVGTFDLDVSFVTKNGTSTGQLLVCIQAADRRTTSGKLYLVISIGNSCRLSACVNGYGLTFASITYLHRF